MGCGQAVPAVRQAGTNAFCGRTSDAHYSQAFGFRRAGRDRVNRNFAASELVGQGLGDCVPADLEAEYSAEFGTGFVLETLLRFMIPPPPRPNALTASYAV